jgi:hypothetical protein
MCGDIVEELPHTQHFKELEKAGQIKGEIEGAKVCYCINEKECGLIMLPIPPLSLPLPETILKRPLL